MAQRNIRLPEPLPERIAEAARKQRYPSSSAFIRAAVEKELNGDHADLTAAEQRIAATLDSLGRELRRQGTAQQAQFALIDALARAILFCLPEPRPEVHDQAIAQAKLRHQKLLKMAGLNMRGDARNALQELVRHGE